MEGTSADKRNKGGRPRKQVRKNQLLAVKCSAAERQIILRKATSACLTVSEYLREMGLKGKIDRREIALPKEILMLSATLNHLAANLNQIAKKRNGLDELNIAERAALMVQSKELKTIAAQIKAHL